MQATTVSGLLALNTVRTLFLSCTVHDIGVNCLQAEGVDDELTPSPLFSHQGVRPAMLLVTFKEKLFIALKTSRGLTWFIWSMLLGNGMLHSRAITTSLIVLHVALQTFAFSIPLSISKSYSVCLVYKRSYPRSVFCGVNDVYDYDTDRRNPRKIVDGLEGTVLDPTYHKDVLVAAGLSTVIILLSALATQCPENILGAVLLVVIAWQYSAPPLRLKEIPIVDSLSNGCLTFLVWFFGFSFFGSSIAQVPLKAIVNNFCAAGVHALAAVADFEADSAAGLRTIATTLGKRPTAIFAELCM
jgi:4-hydroxybenzoate polyprenyltransferase